MLMVSSRSAMWKPAIVDSVVFHPHRAPTRALGNGRDDRLLGEQTLMWIQRSSYTTSYTVAMADTITFRPDEDTTKALEVLTKDGTAVSVAVRSALIDAARRKAGAAIRAEAERLAEDESDRAEAMQVLRDMETLRAW